VLLVIIVCVVYSLCTALYYIVKQIKVNNSLRTLRYIKKQREWHPIRLKHWLIPGSKQLAHKWSSDKSSSNLLLLSISDVTKLVKIGIHWMRMEAFILSLGT